MLSTGDIVGRYEVEQPLGEGGMASVYRVRHVDLGSHHALKLLDAPTELLRQRMLQEGQAQARLRHPNLVSVTDILDHNDQPVLIMELIEGPPLDEWLNEQDPSMTASMSVFKGVVRGVRYAHRRGMIHRDLKPANILITEIEDGWVPKIVDFGLVKNVDRAVGDAVTQTGVAMGTPEYMAPEQIRDAASVDHRADLFSLGCVLYQLMTRRVAFGGPDTLAIFNAVTQGQYTDPHEFVPDLPQDVVYLIGRLLRIDPADRLQTADELLEQLETLDLTQVTAPSPESSPPERSNTWEPEQLVLKRPPEPVVHEVRAAPPLWQRPPAVVGIVTAVCSVLIATGIVMLSEPPAKPKIVDADLASVLSSGRDVMGRLEVEGDARDVWVESGGGRQRPGTLPPGSWTVLANFGRSEPIVAGPFEVEAGKTTWVACKRAKRTCTLRDDHRP